MTNGTTQYTHSNQTYLDALGGADTVVELAEHQSDDGCAWLYRPSQVTVEIFFIECSNIPLTL